MRLFNVEAEYAEDVEDAVNHGYIVSYLARRLAETLGYEEEFCDMIADAGLLHDIGKLQLSDKMYGRKKELLRIEEMKYVRQFPELSYKVLCEQQAGTEELRRIVLHQRENYDGSGYPDKLAGEAIPLGSRIIRICDVYVALISDRPYRKAFDSSTAMELMIEEVKNFDMKAFLGFMTLAHEDDFVRIHEYVDRINKTKNYDYSAIYSA
ncbi:MAG: HD domain-containing protein [Lachnospiraceae bacterium]|nr:HD domain-containing protein [Lachnospiraceae bacterium]